MLLCQLTLLILVNQVFLCNSPYFPCSSAVWLHPFLSSSAQKQLEIGPSLQPQPKIIIVIDKCCVYPPVKWCFACYLLVEIIFFGIYTTFSIKKNKKEEKCAIKGQNNHLKKVCHCLFAIPKH